ncbi:MAG: hypothetical protein LN560_03450 [Rickettsia endosymbiont of Sceptobius lativentris]|nr:hypothetical protein [Rickettsia endosymbiont of Sceptobius lativentris]
MRDTLPKRAYKNECGIVNLDSVESMGTHWVAYIKRGHIVKYFDSFGNLEPPRELVRYFKSSDIFYNYKRYQSFNSVNCGHLCIEFLLTNNN